MIQRVPLKSTCPPSCTCTPKVVHNWHHESCSSQSYINNKGDISCEDGCGEYFIKEARFRCPENMNYKSFQHTSQILIALAIALQSAEFDLKDQQMVEFACKLNMEVMKRWHN
ncbi:hypothetical protein pb186bvf_021210 [Paramecium bursaria]